MREKKGSWFYTFYLRIEIRGQRLDQRLETVRRVIELVLNIDLHIDNSLAFRYE